MSFINRIREALKDKPVAPKTITMDDIALCKGPNNIAVRFLNTVMLGLTSGKWVTDKKVQEFLSAHMDHLDTISNEFKKTFQNIEVSETKDLKEITPKQIKSDQKMAATLSKVFEKAAKDMSPQIKYTSVPQEGNLGAFHNELQKNRIVADGQKALRQYSKDPSVLLRAMKYAEGQNTGDIKDHFVQFLKKEYKGNLGSKQDLIEAYKEFIQKSVKEADFGKMQAYIKDDSIAAYKHMLAMSKANLIDPKLSRPADEIALIPFQDLIKDFQLAKPMKPKPELDLNAAKKSIEESLNDGFPDRYEQQRRNFLLDVEDLELTKGDLEKQEKMNAIINEYLIAGGGQYFNLYPPELRDALIQKKSPTNLESTKKLEPKDFDDVKKAARKFANENPDIKQRYSDFINEIQVIQKLPLSKRADRFDQLIKQYFADGADEPISLPDSVRDSLLAKWNK